jgi:O-antigen ligase
MNATAAVAETGRSRVFAAIAAAISSFVALVSSSEPFIGLGLAGAAVLVPVALFSPEVLLFAWLGTGPTLSTWLDFRIGPFPALTPDRAVLAVLVSAVTWRWFWRRQTILPLGRFEALMGIFLASAAVSTLARGGTHLPEMAAEALLVGGLKGDVVILVVAYGMPFLGFFLAKNLLETDVHFRWLLRVYILVGLFVSIVGLLQYFFGFDMFTPTRMQVIHNTERATGTLASAPEFGLVVGTCFLAATLCFLRSRDVFERALLAAVIPVLGVAIVFAKTRATWIGLVVGLTVAAYYQPKLRRRLIAVGLIFSVGLLAAWPFLATTDFIRNRVLDLRPIQSRIILTATALNMFVHSPIYGHGFGRYTYAAEKWEYIVSVGKLTPHHAYGSGVPHNEYMHILILLGLVGFVPYMMIFFLAWRGAVYHYRKRLDLSGPRREIALVALSVLAMYLMGSMTSDAFGHSYASAQLFVLLGALEGQRVRGRTATTG